MRNSRLHAVAKELMALDKREEEVRRALEEQGLHENDAISLRRELLSIPYSRARLLEKREALFALQKLQKLN